MTCPGCIYLAPQLSLVPDIVKAQAPQMPSDLPQNHELDFCRDDGEVSYNTFLGGTFESTWPRSLHVLVRLSERKRAECLQGFPSAERKKDRTGISANFSPYEARCHNAADVTTYTSAMDPLALSLQWQIGGVQSERLSAGWEKSIEAIPADPVRILFARQDGVLGAWRHAVL